MFNPVPVFPVRESFLYDLLDLHRYNARASVVEFSSWGGSDTQRSVSYSRESLLDHQATLGAGPGILRSLKLFGTKAGERPLPLVQAKFSAHYGPANPQWSRIGYIDGLSAYTHWLLNTGARPGIGAAVNRVDLTRRMLHTDAGDIAYELLVACVPLPDLLYISGIRTEVVLESEQVRLALFCGTTGTVKSRVIYDDRQDSPFYRVFMPPGGYASVQMAAEKTAAADDYSVLWQEIGAGTPAWVADLHVPLAYPLGPSPADVESTRSELRASGIVLCGRMAEWRYIDLHEVDWEAVNDAIEHQ